MEKNMAKETHYTSNPLKLAVDGTKLLFQKAPMVAIVLAVFAALSARSGFNDPATAPAGDPPAPGSPELDTTMIIFFVIFGLVVLFGVLVLSAILTGISSYTAAEIAKGREVSFKQAARATFDRLWSFVGLQLLIIAKVILWSLLFIVPGIVMAFRYSLANLSFFDDTKKLKGNAAIKDSIALTKNAWVTTFGTQAFFNIITLGLITPIVDTGSKAALYQQFTALEKAGAEKPKPHTLSYVAIAISVVIAIIALGLLVALISGGASTSTEI